jgi:GT2 family glycosyltransferase
MTEPLPKLAIVIPTIGRYAELRRMLASLAAQTRLPDEILILDQDQSRRVFAGEFPQLKIRVVAVPGSASLKRNAGFKAVRSDVMLVGFMDDDIVLEPQAIENLLRFWQTARDGLGGTGCNWVNAPPPFARRLKSLRLTSRLGLYRPDAGAVLPSGFHTRMTNFAGSTYVQWLPSGAAVYSRPVLEEFAFDEWFEGYSYLEDLDFSYRVGKKYKLAVVAGARFYHHPSPVGRPNWYLFGKKEVLNRLHFVAKHQELSRALCCLALVIRALMSALLGFRRLESSYFKRLAGNFTGAFQAVVSGARASAPGSSASCNHPVAASFASRELRKECR